MKYKTFLLRARKSVTPDKFGVFAGGSSALTEFDTWLSDEATGGWVLQSVAVHGDFITPNADRNHPTGFLLVVLSKPEQ